MSIIIALDPGHVRGFNRGAYTKYYEGTKMYDLAVMLKEEIDKYDGIEAIITRKHLDHDPSLSERGAIAKAAGAKCLLSLHTNACGTDSVIYTAIFRSVGMPKSEALGKKLMTAIVSTVKANGGIAAEDSYGIRTRYNDVGTDYYGVLRGSTGGSIEEALIIEHVFHTNYQQSLWMNNDDNLRKIAIAEAKVLAEHYGASANGETKEPVITTPTKDPDNNECYISYCVKNGDSWWSIALDKLGSGFKASELAKFNNKNVLTILHPGDFIRIPYENKQENYYIYTVKSGDSWWSIAGSQMGNFFKYKTLAEFNGKSTSTVINPGDKIKIPK